MSDKVTKVTIEVGVDEGSVSRARQQIESITALLDRFEAASASAGGRVANRPMGAGIAPPAPPGAPQPPGGGQSGGGPIQRFSPIAQGQMPNIGAGATNVAITANMVQIVANSVQIVGGMGGAASLGSGAVVAGGGGVFAGGSPGFNPGTMPRANPAVADVWDDQGPRPFTRNMSMLAGILHQTGIPYQVAMDIAQKIGPTLGMVGAASLAYAGIRAVGAVGNAYVGTSNMALDQQGGFGLAGSAGGYTSTSARVMNELTYGNRSRDAIRAGFQATGVYQLTDFLTGGQLGRNDREFARGQEIESELAQMRANLNLATTIGMNADYGIPDSHDVSAGRGARQSNDELRRRMGIASSPYHATQIRLARAGLVGLANSAELRGLVEGITPEMAESMSGAIAGSGRFLGASQRIGAAFGGSEGNIRSGALLNLLQGDYSMGNRQVLTLSGMSLDSQQRAASMFAMSQERGSVAQSMAGIAGSSGRIIAATGGSMASVGRALLGGAVQMENAVTELVSQRNMMAAAGAGPAILAQMDEQIAGMQASVAEQRKSAYLLPYQEKVGVASAQLSMAGSNLALTGYSGVSARSNTGYAAQSTAAQAMVRALSAELSDPNVASRLTPEERARLEAELAAAKRAEVDTYRQKMFDVYGEDMSRVGIAGAESSAVVGRAERFGGPRSVYAAQQTRLAVIDQQLDAEKELLSEMRRGKATLREQNEVLARIKNLTAQREQTEEDNLRGLYSGGQALSTLRQQAVDTRRADVNFLYGSAAAFPLAQQSLGQVRDRLARNRAEQERLRSDPRMDPDGMRLAELEAEEQQLSSSGLAHIDDLATYREDMGTRRYRRRLGMMGYAMTRTHASFGSVRAVYQAQLALASKSMTGIAAARDRALAEAKTPEDRERAEERYQEQMEGAFYSAVDAQAQLEQGWQERLISAVYGGNRSFSMIASSFTRRQASMFYGIANRAFGGNYDQSRHYRNQGMLWYQTFARSASPDAFLDKAMMRDSVEMSGSLDINVVVTGQDGNIIGRGRTVANAGDQVKATIQRGGKSG